MTKDSDEAFISEIVAHTRTVAALCEDSNLAGRLPDILLSEREAISELNRLTEELNERMASTSEHDLQSIARDLFRRNLARKMIDGTISAAEAEQDFLQEVQAHLVRLKKGKSDDSLFSYQIPGKRRIERLASEIRQRKEALKAKKDSEYIGLPETSNECKELLEWIRLENNSLVEQIRVVEKYDDEKLRVRTGFWALVIAVVSFVAIDLGTRVYLTFLQDKTETVCTFEKRGLVCERRAANNS